jgi:hypothetical protein
LKISEKLFHVLSWGESNNRHVLEIPAIRGRGGGDSDSWFLYNFKTI